MFVTDTLGNPYVELEHLGDMYEPIAQSRREANEIKKKERIVVVIGNPPYKEKAKGRGGWIEAGNPNSRDPAPLAAWFPPPEWKVGVHAKHLRNLYVYFWRWATWKVFDQDSGPNTGVVCFITVAGFLNGPGFEKMRSYLRRTANEIWVIDCSPEGHQPEVNTRIFQGVQQSVCIVLASRTMGTASDVPATIRFRALPAGHRQGKFDAFPSIHLEDDGWVKCSTEWRAPFRPAMIGAWSTYPDLEELFVYSGSGVMAGRTWVIAPDSESLVRRWQVLVDAAPADKEDLFHPHLRGNDLGDKHSLKIVRQPLAGQQARTAPVARDVGSCVPPVRYGFRSFDRQWIIPDNRLINQPNPELWQAYSERQVYLTALTSNSGASPTGGPALSFTGAIPDLHHYKGSFGGRAVPLWLDSGCKLSNAIPALLAELGLRYGVPVSAEDLHAYIAAVTAHPGFTKRFSADLVTPGLRVPITAQPDIFLEALGLGRTVIWLHTFGDRFADVAAGRPHRSPRMPKAQAPYIPEGRGIPGPPDSAPDTIDHDPARHRLLVGKGYVDNVPTAVWNYEVSGKQVLRHWFSYRKASRERPIMGDRRPPSRLAEIQPDHWLAEYTTELLDLLNVLGCLVQFEPAQAALLERICAGPTISADALRAAGAFIVPTSYPQKPTATAASRQATLAVVQDT